MKLPLIRVAFCCNDPDSGEFTGECVGIDWGILESSPTLLGMTSQGSARRIRFAGAGFKLSHRRFESFGRISYYGNWCWEAVGMKRTEAARLILFARDLGFHCDGGLSALYDALATARKPEDLTPFLLNEQAFAAREKWRQEGSTDA